MQARLRPRSREAQRGAPVVLPVPGRVGRKSAKAVTTIRIAGISGVGSTGRVGAAVCGLSAANGRRRRGQR